MNRSFRFVLATGMAALLAACGGGSSDTAALEQQVQPAWASPALFVPAGTSQLNVALANCEATSVAAAQALDSPQLAVAVPAAVPITSPSLVITSEGNVIFSGVRNGSSTVSEISRVTFSQSEERQIQFSSDANQNGFYVEQGSVGIYTDRSGSNLYLRASDASGTTYFCGSRAQLSPAYAPSEARLAEKFSRGASTWLSSTIGGSRTPTAIVSDTVIWNNQASNTTMPSNQVSARYASLNVNTGALNIGPSGSASSITQSVALSAALASGGYYMESDFSDEDFAAGRAKRVELQFDSSSQGRLKFEMTRGDNVLVIYPALGNPFVLPPPVLP